MTLPGHLRKLELAVAKLNEPAASPRDVELTQVNVSAPPVVSMAPADEYDGDAAFDTHKWELSACLAWLEILATFTICCIPNPCGCYEIGSNHVICRQCKVPHNGSGIKECIQCGICAECVLKKRGGSCPGFKRGGKTSCFGTYDWIA